MIWRTSIALSTRRVTARESGDVDGEEDEEDTESALGNGVAGDGDGDGDDVNDSELVAGTDGGEQDEDGGDGTPANSILSHTTTGTTASKRPLRGVSSAHL